MLAACGNNTADDVEKFINAGDDGDRDEAAKYVCDENKDELLAGISEENINSFSDVSCEEDGDDVECRVTSTAGGEETEIIMVFGMDNGKVCEIKDLRFADE